MSDYATVCQDANRIAAQLRNRQPLTLKVKLNTAVISQKEKRRLAYTPISGIRGKGVWLQVKKQAVLADVLAFCHEFFEENDQLPTQAVVAAKFDVCEPAARGYMLGLDEAGHIERNAVGKWRFARSRV